jgi:hypothetical protein
MQARRSMVGRDGSWWPPSRPRTVWPQFAGSTMDASRDRCRRPRHRRRHRARLALHAADRAGRVGPAPARCPQWRAAVPGCHGGGHGAASSHPRRDRGHGTCVVDGPATVERSRPGGPGAGGHPRGRQAAEAAGGTPGAGVNRLSLPVGPCGGCDRAGPQPGTDPPANLATTAGQGACRAVRGATRVPDGLGAPGRDGPPADRRRRRSVDGSGGDSGRRPAARSPLSPGWTPQAPCPGFRETGRTAG